MALAVHNFEHWTSLFSSSGQSKLCEARQQQSKCEKLMKKVILRLKNQRKDNSWGAIVLVFSVLVGEVLCSRRPGLERLPVESPSLTHMTTEFLPFSLWYQVFFAVVRKRMTSEFDHKGVFLLGTGWWSSPAQFVNIILFGGLNTEVMGIAEWTRLSDRSDKEQRWFLAPSGS